MSCPNCHCKDCFKDRDAIHAEAMDRIRNMTSAEFRETSIRAGIHYPDGTLTPEYGGELKAEYEPTNARVTDEQFLARQAADRKSSRDAWERRDYERLKKKFEVKE